MKTAILVDGGFYRRLAQRTCGDAPAAERAKELHDYCCRHVNFHRERDVLYRVFYYDCPPISKVIYHPFLQRNENLGRTDLYKWTLAFFDALKRQRKFALRLGRLAEEQAYYSLRPEVVKKLCSRSRSFDDLSEADFALHIEQKGVDMKIGVDIASLAYKRLVDRIVLISGDSDFVPAAKLARREGIDFILDPLDTPIKPDLFEHIDGMRTFPPFRPRKQEGGQPIEL